ncbi:hypothetical protein PDN54_29665, partial [Bacillus cereus group sp. Bc252]|uniref:hypothetical protein n=1 Tax=Bacillus cereus group sp. Bc252 TaxID=3018104 RepID=UPI0022E18608
PKIQSKVAGYFLILNGGMEHVSMQQRLLELEMLQNRKNKRKRREHRPGEVYNRHIHTRGYHTPN